jgi:iron complex transport system permease protein
MTDIALAAAPKPLRRRLRNGGVLALFACLLATACVISLGLGRLGISPAAVIAILASKLFPVAPAWTPLDESVVTLVRAPRIVLAALAGAGLAMCGASLQGVFRNPLVAPQILGISGGAAFGGALAIILGVGGGLALIGSSFAFGLAAVVTVGFLARVDGRSEIATVVLAGIITEAMFNALVSLMQFLADPQSSLPAIVGWLLGSFATATWSRVWLAAPVILAGMAGLFLLRYRVNLLSLGDDDARSFGVRVGFERWLVFICVAMVTGGVISVSGIVGWVGLVIPHAARLIVGPDHRILVPASALLGGTYLVLIDTVARTATAAEIPLGVLTALIGAPVFAILLRRLYGKESRT